MKGFTYSGDFGAMIFDGATGTNGEKTSRYLSLNQKASLNFFKRIAVMKTNLIANSLGLFSFGKMGNRNEVRFASLGIPEHLLKSRESGCVWDPSGRINMTSSSFDVEGLNFQSEQCPDFAYESCFEEMFGVGNDIENMMATPEGRALVGEMLDLLYTGLGNSFYDVAWYAKHPLIDDADANDWYTVNDERWGAFKKQQNRRRIGGFMTIIDQLKADGHKNYNVQIDRDEISEDGTTFIGDAHDLLKRVVLAQNPTMKAIGKRSGLGSNAKKSVLLVSPSIFQKYEEELVQRNNGIPETLFYQLNASFARQLNMTQSTFQEGVLKYKGYVVVCMDEWEAFDTITGTHTHRVLAVTPGNLGLGFDVPNLEQFKGLGLRMVQHLDDPWMGKIFMSTNFDLGMGIPSEEFIVNASRTFVPKAA